MDTDKVNTETDDNSQNADAETTTPNAEADVKKQNTETNVKSENSKSQASGDTADDTNGADDSAQRKLSKNKNTAAKQPNDPAPNGQRTVQADKVIIAKILEKFPLFKGLSAYQYQQILSISAIRVFEKSVVVFKESDTSQEMFILISGELQVMYHQKTVLTKIKPISLVGELAFFTGEQGFSSVVASANSTVISIPREELFHLLKRDCGLSFNIFMNVINELATKLRKNDELIDKLKKQ